MFEITVLGILYLLVAIAGVVVSFWLAFTAIRAMNVYIALNDPSLSIDHRMADPDYEVQL